MKLSSAILSGSVFLLLSSSAALAECSKDRIRFFVDRDGTYTSNWDISGDRKICGHFYRAGGRATFYGLKVLVRPNSGVLEPRGAYSTVSFRYRAKPGFTGKDFFVIQICGESLGNKGCARLEYNVTVR